MSNQLINESSLYLQQHAHNPVHWHAWGDAAFHLAQKEDKPVLVSIGYAACHWCHVMERESFENTAVANYMNEHFVCIKVDREEHPEVDHFYMDAVQAMTGYGGWPLNVFAAPDKKPFYGGTYFPPQPMYNRMSWMEVLQAVQHLWQTKREEIVHQTGQMMEHFQRVQQQFEKPETVLSGESVHVLAEKILQQADEMYGGFGRAPKFLATEKIRFCLAYAHFYKNSTNEKQQLLSQKCLQQALLTLDFQNKGGLYDQLEGGWARYSTDDRWHVPHFEKMLYDNALLLMTLAEAYQLTKSENYAAIITQTIQFWLKEMLSDEGGFYSAIDADSEGKEGEYYTFKWNEIAPYIDKIHPAVLAYYSIVENGNWEDTNILYIDSPEEEILKDYALEKSDWEKHLAEGKAILLQIRKQKQRPNIDNKQLLSWNALMNQAMVKCALALGNSSWLHFAEKHLFWMLNAFEQEGKWKHVKYTDAAKGTANLEDLSCLLQTIIHGAPHTSHQEELLTKAHDILSLVLNDFSSENQTLLSYTSKFDQSVPFAKTEVYDGAVPSSNSWLLPSIWVLGNIFENTTWLNQYEAMLQVMAAEIIRVPEAYGNWALELLLRENSRSTLLLMGTYAPNALLSVGKKYSITYFAAVVKGGESTIPAFSVPATDAPLSVYRCSNFTCDRVGNSLPF